MSKTKNKKKKAKKIACGSHGTKVRWESKGNKNRSQEKRVKEAIYRS